MMEQHFIQVAETMKWMTQAMVQNGLTVNEGDDAGPPPNVQIPLNLRQIINDESNKFRTHKMARLPYYIKTDGSKIRRYPVPDARVSWNVTYPSYAPECYTASMGSTKSFDTLDPYIMDEFKNPVGRTGICGRGQMHFWGDNRQLILAIWRWLKDPEGENITKGGQEIIQVLAIRRTRYLNWQLPNTFMDDDLNLPIQFRTIFYEQCFGKGAMSDNMRENFNYMLSENNETYENKLHDGYMDDHQNTG